MVLEPGARSRGEESKNRTMISGGKVQLKESRTGEKEGKGCLCANKEKPQLNNTMAA